MRENLTRPLQAVNYASCAEKKEKLEFLQGFTYPSRVWGTAVLRRLVGVAHVALLALTALAGAVAINNVAALLLDSDAPAGKGAAVSEGTPAVAARDRKRMDTSIILKRNLFGTEPVAVVEERPLASAGGIDLLLRGTANVEGRGFAIFEDASTGEQDVFAIDERIFDGPRLLAIGPAHAIVVRKGKRQRIELAMASEASSAADSSRAAVSGGNGSPTGGVRETGDGSFLIDRREVDHAIENLSFVMTQARAVPVLRGGESVGFKIFNIKPGSIFERLGIRNGDIVQRVNGVAINDPSRAVGLLDEVQSMDQIKLDFLRGGKPETFAYAIR